jgi:signal transduction histidine kinase
MSEYIQSSLFYSEHAHCDFQAGALGDVVEAAAAMVRAHCEHEGIKITLRTSPDAILEMDKSLIQRAISNVLSNAVDASGKGSEIRMEVDPLYKDGAEHDWIRIQVIDQGEGISPENLQKLFTPFFTTKNRGDGRRGSGLGLAICGKVVQMHGGTVDITSQPGTGTRVSIDLPLWQKGAASRPFRALSRPRPDLVPIQSFRGVGHETRSSLYATSPPYEPPAARAPHPGPGKRQ